jgi:hypothetical protein
VIEEPSTTSVPNTVTILVGKPARYGRSVSPSALSSSATPTKRRSPIVHEPGRGAWSWTGREERRWRTRCRRGAARRWRRWRWRRLRRCWLGQRWLSRRGRWWVCGWWLRRGCGWRRGRLAYAEYVIGGLVEVVLRVDPTFGSRTFPSPTQEEPFGCGQKRESEAWIRGAGAVEILAQNGIHLIRGGLERRIMRRRGRAGGDDVSRCLPFSARVTSWIWVAVSAVLPVEHPMSTLRLGLDGCHRQACWSAGVGGGGWPQPQQLIEPLGIMLRGDRPLLRLSHATGPG